MARAWFKLNEHSFNKPWRMPRTPEQFDQMREESREKILDVALRLFARNGYSATSVRMIAEEAGISQGLLYNYYDGKQALLRAIFERSMRDVDASFARAARAATPRKAIEVLVHSAFEIVRDHRDFWQLSYQLRMQSQVLTGLAKESRLSTDAIRARIEGLLRSAGVNDPAVEARVMFAAIDGVAQHYVLDPKRYPLDDVADEIVRRFLPARRR